MLDANLKDQLKDYLEKVTLPVEIVASVDDGDKSRELLGLLAEIADLSRSITVIPRRNHAERKPSFSVNRADQETGIRFAGLPMGHEFSSLILALLQVGGYPPKASPEVIEQTASLQGELHFETYVSLSCQNCPEVVQSLNLMALLNPNIRHVMIDGALFRDEVDARRVMTVPSVYLNGRPFGQGRMGLEEILSKLDTDSAAGEAERLASKAPCDVLVVGGGPAGAAAAIYAARKGIRTGVVSERFGGQVLDTLAIENFISVQETDGPRLAAALEQHVKRYDVDVMNLRRATSLRAGELMEVELSNGAVLKSKSVILATGARWRELNVPGERDYRGRGVAYCPHCDGPLFKGKRVAVIGGGNSGVEAAIDLAGLAGHVTVLEFERGLKADAVLQRKLAALGNVDVITGARTTEILGDGGKVDGLLYQDRSTDEAHRLEIEGVFVQIGLLPNTEWLKDSVALTEGGEIEVDERGRTSLPGVFATGDATTAPFKQIIIAMGDGAKAALGACEYLIRAAADPSYSQQRAVAAAASL